MSNHEKTINVPIIEIKSLCRRILQAIEIDPFVVESWTEIAMNRDLLGDFARGTSRLPTMIDRIEKGLVSKKLEITYEQVTSISARVFSTYRNWPDEVGLKSAEYASQLAMENGIGIVAFPKPNIIGESLRPVIAANQVGIIFVQNSPLLNFGISKENLVGNNPVAICAPGEPPFLYDGSLGSYSRHSMASLIEYAEFHGELPFGIVLDKDGNESKDPSILHHLLQGNRSNGSFPPLGGMKGMGLAMGIEFLAGALTGGFFQNASGKPWGEGALIIAFSSLLFKDSSRFGNIDEYLKQFTSYPGQNSYNKRQEALSKGFIIYPERIIVSIREVGKKYGISM